MHGTSMTVETGFSPLGSQSGVKNENMKMRLFTLNEIAYTKPSTNLYGPFTVAGANKHGRGVMDTACIPK